MTERVAISARIRGRVQGVWFRSWTEEQAGRRGLSGWVRNEPDGTVAALFVGPRAAVDGMLDACREGPAGARVDGIDAVSAEMPPVDSADAREFRVLR